MYLYYDIIILHYVSVWVSVILFAYSKFFAYTGEEILKICVLTYRSSTFIIVNSVFMF